jgi:hypothetical protein
MSEPHEYKNVYVGLSEADAKLIREARDGVFIPIEDPERIVHPIDQAPPSVVLEMLYRGLLDKAE